MRSTFFFAALLVAIARRRERARAIAGAVRGCAPAQTVTEP